MWCYENLIPTLPLIFLRSHPAPLSNLNNQLVCPFRIQHCLVMRLEVQFSRNLRWNSYHDRASGFPKSHFFPPNSPKAGFFKFCLNNFHTLFWEVLRTTLFANLNFKNATAYSFLNYFFLFPLYFPAAGAGVIDFFHSNLIIITLPSISSLSPQPADALQTTCPAGCVSGQ